MKLIWITDPHMEFLNHGQVTAFLADIKSQLSGEDNALLITGDISNARMAEEHWARLVELNIPIYFVLGNHDYYGGSIERVHSKTEERLHKYPQLHWINGEAIRLSDTTFLVGADGWGDGRAGIGLRSTIRLNDSNLIEELKGLDSKELFELLAKLGDGSCLLLKGAMSTALTAKAKQVIIATHVPPFVEASLYNNAPSEPAFAPHFVNDVLGRYLLEVAKANPTVKFRVLCGHTHHTAAYTPVPNLTVSVGGADYYYPKVTEILTFP